MTNVRCEEWNGTLLSLKDVNILQMSIIVHKATTKNKNNTSDIPNWYLKLSHYMLFIKGKIQI